MCMQIEITHRKLQLHLQGPVIELIGPCGVWQWFKECNIQNLFMEYLRTFMPEAGISYLDSFE